MHAATQTFLSERSTNATHDFRVCRLQDRDWETVPLSKQALSWAKANFDADVG